MIRRLKVKFILLAMVSLFLLLTLMVVGMNVMSYNAVVDDADTVLTLLAENRGTFPDIFPDFPGKIPSWITPETPYESRYFTVLLDARTGEIQVKTT